jgi:hypothetical protein
MISYLSGDALLWFQLYLSDPNPDFVPSWLQDYQSFVNKLVLNFGKYRPQEDAKLTLENLIMQDHERIQPYVASFNRYAVLAKWDEQALS